MKRFIIPAALLVLLAGCAKTEGDTPESRIPIRLTSGMTEVATKAAIHTGDEFTAAIAGWETNGTVDYAAIPSWNSRAVISASASAAGNAVTLDPAQYYAADDDVKTYIKGWHPAEAPGNDALVHFAKNDDGSIDPMITAPVQGSKTDSDSKSLIFEHPTTQIRFEVEAGSGLDPQTKIRSITVKNVQLPTGLNLADNSVIYTDTPADLPIPGISEAEITPTAIPAGQPVMIKPLDTNTLTLDVTTSAASFTGITATIHGDTKLVPGKAYTITLTFQQKEVLLKASVTDWNTSGTGSGTIE